MPIFQKLNIFIILMLFSSMNLDIPTSYFSPLVVTLDKPFYGRIINIVDYVYEIPKENMYKYVELDLRIQPHPYDLIKCFEDNSNYTLFYLQKSNVDYWNFTASYVCLKNMICSNYGSFCCENLSLVIINNNTNGWLMEPMNGSLINHYENIVAETHRMVKIFGHFISDVMIPLMIFPQEIIEKSCFILNYQAKAYQNYFSYIGIPPNRVILLRRREWVFATNLYVTINPLINVAHYGKLSNKFSNRLRNYFNVTNLVPTNYFITNRGPTKSRHISNIDEVAKLLIDIYPERNFTVLRDIYDFNKAAYLWASAILVFGPTGSNLFKHYIMANKTILVVIASDMIDWSLAKGAASHEVFTLFFPLPGMSHFGYDFNILNLTKTIKVIEIALFCIDHGYFNPKEQNLY